MRIAIAVPDNLDSRRHNGFIPAFRNLHSALDRHERIVFAPSGGDVALTMPQQEGSAQKSSEESDIASLRGRYLNTIAASRDFAAKVKPFKPDRIIAFNSMGLFLSEKHIYYTSTAPYSKIARLCEGEYPDTPRYAGLIDYYRFVGAREKENYDSASRIIVLSRRIRKDIMEEHGIDGKKITYIHRAIPDFLSNPNPSTEPIPGRVAVPGTGNPDKIPVFPAGPAGLARETKTEPGQSRANRMRIIIMPAELRVMKGVRYAIEAMKLLKKDVPEAVLMICGRVNNYEQDYMRSLLKEAKGKANIIVTGFLSSPRLYDYMRMSECAFMPFCFDECPMALSESIGHGLPIITNEYCGFAREEIERFGRCCRYKDVADYASGLEKMLCDPGELARKAQGAREAVKRFSFLSYSKAVNDVVAEA